MEAILLMCVVALENLAPLVKTEVRVRCGEDGAIRVGRGKDERPDRLVELKDAVVRERSGRRRVCLVRRARRDFVLRELQ